MPPTTFPVHHQWDPALPIRVNTAAVILPGRGETPRSYQRLGARLAYDTFGVTVFDPVDIERITPAAIAADILARADGAGSTNLVVIGHDAGANLALRLAPQLGSRLTALILSSPGRGTLTAALDWPTEQALRSGCPAYLGQLDADPLVRRGSLTAGPVVDPLLDLAELSAITAPVLLLSGADDPLADEELLAALRSSLPRVTSVEVRDGKRDVLNDKTSRSVSGEIVKFVEWARSGDLDQPLLRYLVPSSFVPEPPTTSSR